MRIAGSNRYFLNPSEKKTLSVLMAKNRTEERELSDGDSSSASLEEISAEDFKQQDARLSSRSNVWMGDLMRYPVSRNFGQDLYSFAWAQAVQNKPLGFDVKEEACDVVIEDSSEELGEGTEKEEGELEEGEIELGSESVSDEVKIEMDSEEKELVKKDIEEIGDFDKRVGVILEELETITVEEAETSFEGVCSRLEKSFASLKQIFSENYVPVLDALVQQAFMGIQIVYSVFSSGNLKKEDQNKESLLRLLFHIKNQYSIFLTTEQVQEIDVRVQSLASEAVNVEKTTVYTGSGSSVNGFSNLAERPGISSPGLVPSEKPSLESRAANPVGSNGGKAGLPKLELPANSRNRVDFSPLLNLHADYDEDSLPSPTRENAPPFPIPKPIGFGMEAVAATQPITPKNVEAEDGTLHPYVTDALKAVSSYQQKYGRNSLLATNRLPSPTPSEECNDDDDSHGEVSSSSVASNARSVSTASPFQAVGSSSSGATIDSSSGLQLAPVKMVGHMGLEPNPVIKAPAKSRDPRLRFINSEVVVTPDLKRSAMTVDSNTPKNGLVGGSVNSRKHKAVDEPVPDDHSLKRPRNGSTSSRDVQVSSGRGGWIEDNGAVTSQMGVRIQSNENMAVGLRKPGSGEVGPDRRLDAKTNSIGLNAGSEQNPPRSSVPTVSLPSLLKDIAVNPTMLMQLIKMEQQRLAAEAQQKTIDPAVNGLPGAVSSAIGAFSKSSEVAQNPAGKPQMPPQTTSTNAQNDVGRIRMKPRDPRRILHTNMVQKNESLGSEQTKTSGTLTSDTQSSKDHLPVREQGEQAQTTGLPSQSTTLPDIAQQFTKNLKNLADIVSSSQITSTASSESQNIPQPIPSKMSKDSSEPKTVSGLSSQGGTTSGALQLVNPWGDVDHLLDGYDDQQKAAIQKERARRIAEQSKMFAARKLCLVLDLDHTLLNSAKFVEVDQAHEEILRKKEEQDREKPQRHLFRFQHMGMWTKLRPGIWNFLEKASKLYELHLYTMGNKLYATEMAKVLDPTGALFAGRVISRGDDGDPFDGDERVPKSKDLDGVLGMESAVVIIDDSVRVWPLNKLNLIVVERYTYFPCSRRQFGLLGPSLLEIDHDERPEDGTLASSLAVIERIHENFFSHHSLNEVDVRNILASEQRKILAGCKIVFSRVFPVGEANPHLHPLWQTAEQFGAACTNQIDEQVTHVVANSLGTDKVNWALSTGRFVVHPGWVEASALLYRRANEHDFAVKL